MKIRKPIQPSKKSFKRDFSVYVAKGLTMIHASKLKNDVKNLLNYGDPVSALANSCVVMMQKLDKAARDKGTEVHDSVKILGSYELINALADIGKAAGIMQLDESNIELAYSVAVERYVKSEIAAGRIDPIALKKEMQKSIMALPEEERQKAVQSMKRVQETAKAYKGGNNGNVR